MAVLEDDPGRARGSIEKLPSGAYRVKVYAGRDPVTKKRHDLREVIPAGPKAATRARAARDRLILEVEERRNPRTSATLSQLLDKYMEQFEGSERTRVLYNSYIRKHIEPLIGHVKVGALDAEILDSFYAELRRCRDRCDGRPFHQHRTTSEHQCDDRCGPHVCRPLSATTVRHMHFILSGAYRKAMRWRWVALSPVDQAEPPPAPTPNPIPPSPTEAAQILNKAWRDPYWGSLIWVAMTTGARRGELCALRWSSVELTEDRCSIWLRRAISEVANGWREGELKTHQQRRIALDPVTVAVLEEHLERCRLRCERIGTELQADGFVFSSQPDGSGFIVPRVLTRRFDRFVGRLGIETTFHKLRHYSATELIAAGVDVRTVAGRLGHAGGGSTTLRAYSAWVAEADQRAAQGIGAGMPNRPEQLTRAEYVQTDPVHPYEVVAVRVRELILAGELQPGDPAPAVLELAAMHGVSRATAQRALSLLRTWGLVGGEGTKRSVVLEPLFLEDLAGPSLVEDPGLETHAGGRTIDRAPPTTTEPLGEAKASWIITLVGPDGHRYTPRTIYESMADSDAFRLHLVAIARREVPAIATSEGWIADYELEVKATDESEPVATLRWVR